MMSSSCNDSLLFNCELRSDLFNYSPETDLFNFGGFNNHDLEEFFDSENCFSADQDSKLQTYDEMDEIEKFTMINPNATLNNDDIHCIDSSEDNLIHNDFVELPTSSSTTPTSYIISYKSAECKRYPTIVVTKIMNPMKRKLIITRKIPETNFTKTDEPVQREIKIINNFNYGAIIESSPTDSARNTDILILTEEEKRTLIAEGYSVPTKLPLTKMEEKALKKIQRKIKNKMSAQESRRKKKDYVESLEKRLNTSTQENGFLKQQVQALELSNRSLLCQLQQLQQLLGSFSTPKSAIIMTVMAFMALSLGLFLPSSMTLSNTIESTESFLAPTSVYYTPPKKSRILLSVKEESYLHKSKWNDWFYMWSCKAHYDKEYKNAFDDIDAVVPKINLTEQEYLSQLPNETLDDGYQMNIVLNDVTEFNLTYIANLASTI